MKFQDTQEEWTDAAGNTTTLMRFIGNDPTNGMLVMETHAHAVKAQAWWDATFPKPKL